MQVLAEIGGAEGLMVLDSGETTLNGSAPARRVALPLGRVTDSNFNWKYLNNNGRLIVQRALEWARDADIELGPIAHWKLDETSGTLAVDSAGGHDGSLVGGPIWSTGQIAGGLLFDGGDDEILVPYHETLSLTEAFTFTAWINADNYSDYQAVLTKGEGSQYNYWFGTLGSELLLDILIEGTWHSFTTSGANLTPGNWYHVAATFNDSTDSISLYIDGVETANGVLTLSLEVNTADLLIGSSTFAGEIWPGVLDEVRIYDRMLVAAEIAALALTQTSLPVAHWKLDDATGTTAIDSVGGNDGTLINGPAWVTGMLDGGLSFDGSNDYIDVSSMNPISYDDFTIIAWYKSADTGVSDDEYIFMHGDGYVDALTFGPTDDVSDRLRLATYVNDVTDRHYGTSDIVDQQWHHLVAVRSGGRIRLYVDGAKETDEVDAYAGVTITVDGDGPFIGDYPGVSETSRWNTR